LTLFVPNVALSGVSFLLATHLERSLQQGHS
jgi:hypothetical protein